MHAVNFSLTFQYQTFSICVYVTVIVLPFLIYSVLKTLVFSVTYQCFSQTGKLNAILFLCSRFKVPSPEEAASPGAVQNERDTWVKAIHKLCSHWKRKSRSEHMFAESKSLQQISIPEDVEDNDTDLESSGGFAAGDFVPAQKKISDFTSEVRDCLVSGEEGQSSPSADMKPVPTPRIGKIAVQVTARPDPLSPVPSPTSHYSSVTKLPSSPSHSPCHAGLTTFFPDPESEKPASPIVKKPPPMFIPAPPPLPVKITTNKKSRTKAFHWDLVGPEKVNNHFYFTFFQQRMLLYPYNKKK